MDIRIEVPGQDEELRLAPMPEDARHGSHEKRRFNIKGEDVTRHGRTLGCPGCRAAIGIGSNMRHSDECRQRFEDILVKLGDPRIERWMHKLAEAMQDRIEEETAEAHRHRAQMPASSSNDAHDRQADEPQNIATPHDVPAEGDVEIHDNQDDSAEPTMGAEDDVIMSVLGGESRTRHGN